MINSRTGVACLLALATLGIAQPALAQTERYADRATFIDVLGASVTDTYENPGYKPSQLTVLTDEQMDAVLGETRYVSTTIADHNVISTANGLPDNHFYCAGCNGTFRLSFVDTSVGTRRGVYGVGFDIYQNQPLDANSSPMRAVILFGDGTLRDIPLPEQTWDGLHYTFFGFTSSRLIAGIGVVDSPLSSASFAIDNLTIGSAVPEPASWGLMGMGLLALGGVGCGRVRRMV
jgi:hypothetical protein